MINFKEFPPTFDPNTKPPVLTIGLIIFTLILCVIRTFTLYNLNSLVLYPRAPLDLNLNSLSFYSMVHTNFFHWICNIFTLLTPLAIFEMRNGTIHTGVTLNLLTVVAGLQYCLAGLLFYPNTGVVGLSGIAFLFMSYMAYQESKFKPIFYTWHFNNMELKIYTIYLPFFIALFFMVLFPSSSFPGHVTGILTGYLLALGYLNKLYPPSHILVSIEKKVSSLINLLGKIVTFYKEDECLILRNNNEYTPMLNQGADIEQGMSNNSGSSNSATFQSETRVLGTRDSTA